MKSSRIIRATSTQASMQAATSMHDYIDSMQAVELARTQAALTHALQAFKSRAFSCSHSQLESECSDVLSGQAEVRTTGVDKGAGKPSRLAYGYQSEELHDARRR